MHITSRADDTGRRCINILTQEEAEILLKALKESLVNFISIPDNGTNLDFKVKSNQPLEMFTINLYKGNIGKKYNIEARISKNNVIMYNYKDSAFAAPTLDLERSTEYSPLTISSYNVGKTILDRSTYKGYN